MGFAIPAMEEGQGAVDACRADGGARRRRRSPAVCRRIENLQGGRFRKIEYRVVGDDGKERWIESEWRLEIDRDGQPRRAFVAISTSPSESSPRSKNGSC